MEMLQSHHLKKYHNFPFYTSGKKVLDDAAIKIVELAAPYAAFPENIENKVDILHILRTWQFINNRSFK